jgi:hypothetical protein
MKKLVKKLFSYCDIHVQRLSTMPLPFVDMRHEFLTPQQLAADAGLKPILVDLPLNSCRYGAQSIYEHPYYIALSLHGDSIADMTKWLCNYLNTVKAISASAFMGLREGQWPLMDEESFEMKNYYPWNTRSPCVYKAWIDGLTMYENEREGYKCNPSSYLNTETWINVQSQQHTVRLYRLKQSMEQAGYKRSDHRDGDVGGNILIGDNDSTCWTHSGGTHRKIVAAYLGYKTVPVRISRIVRKTEAKYWKSVREGLISVEVAKQIFDNVMQGVTPFAHCRATKREQKYC